MALFALLAALFIERMTSLTQGWQFQYWFEKLALKLATTFERTSNSFKLLVLVLPALIMHIVLSAVEGVLFGIISLVIWTLATLMCVGCVYYRTLYKKYLLAVSHQDVQASYHLASQLADVQDINVDNKTMLGARVGRQLTWINYRFYCAVILMMVIGGPVAMVFYATVRAFDVMMFKGQLPDSNVVRRLLFILDWLPARMIALCYVLVGNFSHAIGEWGKTIAQPSLATYDVLTRVAMASEQFSYDQFSQGEDSVCMESTCRLVKLAKRTAVLLVAVISMLTIAGVLI
ncbi:beta-lactamase regulator AmpE [Psychrobium sp. 1_MG-2023]|uniref:beta-lactamase regulator AmpE n=1 Tax=Psychrobium sp. 1_MG-2023 TaxID=3062624 RepID=UPI002734BA63|nr:beta-lactamase regulator AmpE [Psychrobium sp. 1_MG-2023]MDP2562041.1 beta-lactamase regulator AmpE [Psychrobium sp. 1_MG-2023]